MTGTELVVAERQTIEAVERQVQEAIAVADAIEVRNPNEATIANEVVSRFAKQRREWEAKRKHLVGPLVEAKKRIDQEFKDLVAPVDAADQNVRGKLQAYLAEQERIRREEQERLDREARERERIARKARQLQEAEVEAYRVDAERDARIKAEAARKSDDEAAAKEADEAAAKAEEAKTAEAAVKALPTFEAPRAVVQEAAPLRSASGGTSTRKVWKFEVVDATAVPRDYLAVNEQSIRQAVRDGVREIPGVRVYQDDQLAVRAS